jgi:hypothetical protein
VPLEETPPLEFPEEGMAKPGPLILEIVQGKVPLKVNLKLVELL